MRKRVFGRKLNRNRRSRTALFRSLAKAMVLHGSITTTKAKAKAVTKELDRLMGLVKKDSVDSRREAYARLANDRVIVNMLFEKYGGLASSRSSGFTTMSLLAPRRGDAAEMVTISWVEMPEEEVVAKKKDKKGSKKQK